MPGRTPQKAWDDYIGPMRKALQCITLGRFVLLEKTHGIEIGTRYSAALNEMGSVRLKSRDGIYFVAGQTVEITDR